MSPLDKFLANLQTEHPEAIGIATERILKGGSLVDTRDHKPKGISEACARAALIMVCHLVSQLGVKIVLTSDEENLVTRTKQVEE